jgi:hypothetical protein
MKYALIVLLCVLGMSCQKNDDVNPNKSAVVDIFLGKWKLVAFENSKTLSFETVIDITKNKDNPALYVINGKGPVNFFWMNCEVDNTKNSLKMGSINGTSIVANIPNGSAEVDLLERFSESVIFEYSSDNQYLTFFNAKKTKSLKFKIN